MRPLYYVLEAYRQSVDRLFVWVAKGTMAFFYRRFRLSPEIFIGLCFMVAIAVMAIGGARDMAFAIAGRSVSLMLLALLPLTASAFFGMLCQFKINKTPKEWTAQRYKKACAEAMAERENGISLRLMHFLIFVMTAGNLLHHVLERREIQGTLYMLIFFGFVNLHMAASAAEPPPPEDGDAFYAVPKAA